MGELNERAIKDTLTGLYNRRYMDEVIPHIVKQHRRTGLAIGFIMADIDYFKKYNDTYGHQAGDVLLVAFSQMLASLVKRQTDFVFRYGGEEFAIIFSSTSAETVEQMAEQIIRGTRDLSCPHEASPFNRITVSIGAICTDSPGDLNFDDLVRSADQALYEAKDAGRDRFVMRST